MFSLQFLDISLGLIVVYLLLSLSCTVINEFVSRIMSYRAKDLEAGIKNMLKDHKLPNLAKDFYSHPLIKGLSREGSIPSYISAQSFTKTLLSNIAPIAANSANTMTEVRGAIEKLNKNSEVRKTLLALIDQAGDSVKDFHNNVEVWFDEVMDRVSGWYRKRSQMINIIVALAIAIGANADTLEITRSLSKDPALREALVLQAQELAKRIPPEVASKSNDDTTSKSPENAGPVEKPKGDKSLFVNADITETFDKLNEAGIPLGWKGQDLPQDFPGFINKIIGLLLTALAISLGAPFWFDILKKVVNIRAAGNVPEPPSKPTASQA